MCPSCCMCLALKRRMFPVCSALLCAFPRSAVVRRLCHHSLLAFRASRAPAGPTLCGSRLPTPSQNSIRGSYKRAIGLALVNCISQLGNIAGVRRLLSSAPGRLTHASCCSRTSGLHAGVLRTGGPTSSPHAASSSPLPAPSPSASSCCAATVRWTACTAAFLRRWTRKVQRALRKSHKSRTGNRMRGEGQRRVKGLFGVLSKPVWHTGTLCSRVHVMFAARCRLCTGWHVFLPWSLRICFSRLSPREYGHAQE